MEMQEHISETIQRVSEAYCLYYRLPIRRKFTDEQLESALERVREAIALQQPLELSDFSPHVRSTYRDEKAKDRREEFKHSDACSKAGVAE